MRPRLVARFLVVNVLTWILMTVILVVVPDTLEPWLGFEVARVIGWAVACGVWVLAVESDWQARFGPLVRFGCQLVLWVAAALLAIWISDQARPW